MQRKLFYNTVTPLLRKVLNDLMASKEFKAFRLVGGTSLSLQKGHRESVDIDLFTEAEYGSVDFKVLDRFLRKQYKHVDTSDYEEIGMGKSYTVGNTKTQAVKIDIYYTDAYIRPAEIIDYIRLASVEEIIAMKLDVISRGGRKKDFWDLHEVMDEYPLKKMLALHKERYPYAHDKKLIVKNFTEFTEADKDFDPVCLRQKYWEVIKLDMIDFVKGL